MPQRLLIVDDHAAVREGLTRSLRAHGLEVVGDAGDGASALRLAGEQAPDVMLVDISLPDTDGISLTRAILTAFPTIKVIVLSMFTDDSTRRAALAEGAVAYLAKECTTQEIVAAIRRATRPHGTCRGDGGEPGGQRLLSARETEVLQLVADGASTQAIAQTLYISLKTAKNHLANIYEKLDVPDRTQAVLMALRLGSIQLRS